MQLTLSSEGLREQIVSSLGLYPSVEFSQGAQVQSAQGREEHARASWWALYKQGTLLRFNSHFDVGDPSGLWHCVSRNGLWMDTNQKTQLPSFYRLIWVSS